MKNLIFGEIIWDVYPDRNTIGGAALNFAGHCVMCGHEGYILSSAGNDELGDMALEVLDKLSVKRDFVGRCHKKTGQSIVTLGADGVPSYNVLTDVAYDNIGIPDIDKIKAHNFDTFYFGTLSQRSAVSRDTLNKILSECSFREIFCDLNLRDGCYDEESVRNCLEHATILKFSDEEAPRLEEYEFWRELSCGSLMNGLFSKYPRLKVILFTKGSQGSLVCTRDGKSYDIPAQSVKVASTVGAGDSFGAAWMSRYLLGDDEKRAAEIASRVSGYVVSVVDALPKYDINDFI